MRGRVPQHLLSKTTPGPGTYRNPQKVQMHQPTFKFPTAERPDPTSRSHLFNPGPGQYTLPGSTAVPTYVSPAVLAPKLRVQCARPVVRSLHGIPRRVRADVVPIQCPSDVCEAV